MYLFPHSLGSSVTQIYLVYLDLVPLNEFLYTSLIKLKLTWCTVLLGGAERVELGVDLVVAKGATRPVSIHLRHINIQGFLYSLHDHYLCVHNS